MNKMRVFIWLIALIGFSACQSKSGQTTEQENVDSLTVAPTEEEKTITGVVGDASMHNFMLVTLEGDTLFVSTMDQEPGDVSGFESGDTVRVDYIEEEEEPGSSTIPTAKKVTRKMKKKMLAATLLTSLLAACGGNSTSIVGAWVEPVPGMEGQVQGINIEEGGIASSVNMATLVYESWKQEGDQLVLTGKSIGNGQTIEFADTMAIKKLTPDSLILDNQGMEIRYAKQK